MRLGFSTVIKMAEPAPYTTVHLTSIQFFRKLYFYFKTVNTHLAYSTDIIHGVWIPHIHGFTYDMTVDLNPNPDCESVDLPQWVDSKIQIHWFTHNSMHIILVNCGNKF